MCVARLTLHRHSQVKKYIHVALDQASDFDHEASVKSLAEKASDPCAGRKTAAPGSVIWCLCNSHGKKIEWRPADDGLERASIDKNLKRGDGPDRASICSNKGDPVRAKECKWKGDPVKGRCCSNKEGCPDALTPALNSE